MTEIDAFLLSRIHRFLEYATHLQLLWNPRLWVQSVVHEVISDVIPSIYHARCRAIVDELRF